MQRLNKNLCALGRLCLMCPNCLSSLNRYEAFLKEEKEIDAEVAEQFQKIRSEMSEIKQSMNDMKKTVERFTEICQTKLTYQADAIETTRERTNPWAHHTTQILTAAMERTDNEVAQRYATANYQTYQPTIEALSTSPTGLSADQVAQITKRSRSIESAYLWKLHLAGLIGRRKRENKIIYVLKDRDAVLRAFGIR